MKQDIPLDIAAGTTFELICELKTFEPGDFTSQIHLYLDDLGLRELVLIVDGTAVVTSVPESAPDR